MKTNIKRTVIATLVAGMLLTSFTACNEEGVAGTYEDVILNAAEDVNSKLNLKTDIKFDKIPVVEVSKEMYTDKENLIIYAYIAPTQEEKINPVYNKGTLYFVKYRINREEYTKLRALCNNSYMLTSDEFTEELENEVNKVVTKYDPYEVEEKKVEHEHRFFPLDEFLGHLEENTEEKGE